jgi:class 3 adenylate cyclase
VHIAARVMAAARPGEVVTSRTVRDLIVGSDIAVEDRGEHALKGIDGSWQLFAVGQP